MQSSRIVQCIKACQLSQAVCCSSPELGSYGRAFATAPQQRLGKRGQKLFTLNVGGQLIASQLV